MSEELRNVYTVEEFFSKAGSTVIVERDENFGIDEAKVHWEYWKREFELGYMKGSRLELRHYNSSGKHLTIKSISFHELSEVYLETCHFCHQEWWFCTCEFGEHDTFEFRGIHITRPNLSECARFFVNPLFYYGEDYVNWLERYSGLRK